MTVHSRTAALTALVAGLALTLTACSSGGSGGSGDSSGSGGAGSAGAGSSGASSSPALSGSITVLAAASLTGSFNQIGKDFQSAHPGTTITFSFGASSALATQITQGVPADVFASAATGNMDTVTKASLNDGDPQNFVSNTAEIAVPPSNPGNVTSLADLAKSDVTVALCQPQVPCGKVAAAVFQKAGITVNPVTQEVDVKSTLAKVTTGAVDAGVVYVTDVKAAGSAVKAIEIPADQNANTEYPIVALKDSKNAELAKAFIDYVTSDAGQKVLTAAGFAAP